MYFTIFDIHDATKTIDLAVDFATSLGLLNTSKTCPKCSSVMKSIRNGRKKDGRIWRCACGAECSIRTGTWFSKSKLSIRKIILIIYCWSVRMTQKQIQRELKLNKETTVNWYNFLRERCFISQRNTVIGGEGVIVQIDESKFGKRKYNRGKRVEGIWVFGGVEVYSDKTKNPKAFMVPVENRSADTLMSVIKARIAPGTTIYSDLWKSYNSISTEGYVHGKVNHSKEFKSSDGVHTNNVEGMWGDVKRNAFPRNGSVKHHYTSYISEFLWRKSVRGTDVFKSAIDMIKRSMDINFIGIDQAPLGFQNSMYEVLTDHGARLDWSTYNARCEERRILKDSDFYLAEPVADFELGESDNLLSSDSSNE